MTPQELKNSILQLAIQGKLVEQRPEEGTGQELYQQIQAEKQRLIKEGKIKKERPLPEISEDEIPFDIPESWKWVYIGDLFQHNTGKALNSSDKSGIPLEYITTSNVYWNRFELGKLKTMLFTDAEIEKCTVQKGDLLVLEGGDIGRAAIWNYDFPMRIQNHIHRLRPFNEICIEFFYYIFFLYKNAGLINGKGIGIQGLSSKVLHKLSVPLPPLAEQKRIVAKIDELMPYIERYDKAWSKLEELNKRFPSDLHKSILQLAIRGKLVEQRPEEGTAEELYQQIQVEKQRLIKEGKIKKEKPLPEISEAEIPFDIPESWKWVKLGEIGYTNIGLTYSPQNQTSDGTIVLRSNNIRDGQMDYEDIVRVNMDIPENKMCHIGDILICARNGSKRLVGKAAIVDREGMSFGAFMAVYRSICNPYVLHVINSAYFRNSLLEDTGTTTINQITQDMLKNALIPLPPLAEQKRIVKKLEEILPLCEILKRD
ncbi:MAG: restriction endonuclease subunit S [Eubacteriales bacterium]